MFAKIYVRTLPQLTLKDRTMRHAVQGACCVWILNFDFEVRSVLHISLRQCESRAHAHLHTCFAFFKSHYFVDLYNKIRTGTPFS